MKKKEIILITILILFLIIIICVNVGKNKKNTDIVKTDEVEEEKYVDVLSDGTKLNKSEKLNNEKNVDGLVFTNIQLTNKSGQTVLLADVKNTNKTSTSMMLVDVIILDKNGNELGKVGGIISPLETGETTQFNTGMTKDYANAYDFKIVKK